MNSLNISKFEKLIFSFFSFISHPLLIPTFSLYILFNMLSSVYLIDYKYELAFEISFIILTILVPIFFLGILYVFNIIKSFYAYTFNDRKIILFILPFVYLFTLHIFKNYSFHFHIIILLSVFVLNTLLLLLLFIFYQSLSFHLYAIGSLWAMILFYCFKYDYSINAYILSLVVLLTGITTTSRLGLKAHNIKDILFGIISGFSGSFLFFNLLDYFAIRYLL
jgi:hypothetical protein